MRRTAIALALLACAPARKPFGELAVSAVHQRLPLQAVLGAAFAIGLLPASSDPPRLWAYRVTAR